MDKLKIYRERIHELFVNSLEFNGDNEKVHDMVKSWLGCEWVLGKFDTEIFNFLLSAVEDEYEAVLKTL